LQYHKGEDTELLGLLEFIELLGSILVGGWRIVSQMLHLRLEGNSLKHIEVGGLRLEAERT
jgi:hypothetical protein